MSLPSKKVQSWRDKVLDADKIWTQLEGILQSRNLELPKTSRRPDVRLIVNNISGVDKIFRNPGDHSNSKAEHIPAKGDETAAMVMVKGDTLSEQYANAAALFKRYNLGKEGLSKSFLQALKSGEALDIVDEAYGKAPYNAQASKLVDVKWERENGSIDTVKPVHGAACSYGARAATDETALRAEIAIYIKGTSTIPERVEGAGMVIAVSEDWQTGAISTRPIVASVAKGFYGKHFDTMPVVEIHPDGYIQKIDLKNGQVIDFAIKEGYEIPERKV